MSHKVNTILLFDKQAKRLSKKYPSLKNDLSALIKKLADDLNWVPPSVIIFIKYGWRLQLKVRAKVEEPR